MIEAVCWLLEHSYSKNKFFCFVLFYLDWHLLCSQCICLHKIKAAIRILNITSLPCCHFEDSGTFTWTSLKVWNLSFFVCGFFSSVRFAKHKEKEKTQFYPFPDLDYKILPKHFWSWAKIWKGVDFYNCPKNSFHLQFGCCWISFLV